MNPFTSSRNAAAYNDNILMMIGALYGSLIVVGVLIYRGLNKNAAYHARLAAERTSHVHAGV